MSPNIPAGTTEPATERAAKPVTKPTTEPATAPRTEPPAEAADQPIDPQVWRTVWVVMVGALAVLFDTTIVAVALHTLSADLHVSTATIQWVATAYLLALAITVPVTGWAQRCIGGKRLWIAGLAVFLIGSIAASLAQTAGELIAFRVVQGLGGGVLLPLMATLVMQAAGGRGIGRIMSVVSLPAILGPVAGPVVGGLLLEHLHWSAMFWINIPFCVAGLVLAARYLPADGPARRTPVDAIGFALLAPGLVGVLYALTRMASAGGLTRPGAIIPAAVGLALLTAFALRASRLGARALVRITLLRHYPLASSAVLLFLAGITLYGAMLVIPLYLQQLRGASVLVTGLLLIPQGVGTLASRALAGRLSDTMAPRYLVTVGFAITLAGTVPFAFAGTETDQWWLMAVLLVRGVGLGVVTVPLMALGYRGLPHDDIPDASIITRIAQQIGGAVGAAVLTIILAGALADAAPSEAFAHTFWWAVGFTAVGLVASLALPAGPPGMTTPVRGAHPVRDRRGS